MAESVVLIVDDDERNARLASDVLRAAGIIVETAATGAAAVELAAALSPHLILLDVYLPDLPGDEVARRLRADATTAAIPVVALTSLPPEDADRLLAHGFDGYLEKPIDIRAFPGQVRAWAEAGAVNERGVGTVDEQPGP